MYWVGFATRAMRAKAGHIETSFTWSSSQVTLEASMLFEADILVASAALTELAPASPGVLSQLARWFGVGADTDRDTRQVLAAVLEPTVKGLRDAGFTDALMAAVDDRVSFVDYANIPDDLDRALAVGDFNSELTRLRLSVRHPSSARSVIDSPYRASADASESKLALHLVADVRLYREVPDDGYPLRVRLHGIPAVFDATNVRDDAELERRVRTFTARHFPRGNIDGMDAVPAEFQGFVHNLAASLGAALQTDRIDTAARTAIVVGAAGPGQCSAARLPFDAAIILSDIEPMPRQMAGARLWAELKQGLCYARTLILDSAGRPSFAVGATHVLASAAIFTPGVAPSNLHSPDVLVFSGHEWETEIRAASLLAASEHRAGLEAAYALMQHERRRFECGSSGPAGTLWTGGGGGGGSIVITADMAF